MRKRYLLWLLVVWTTVVYGQSRGVDIEYREEDGAETKVKLYSGSYALVIGVSDYSNGLKDLPGVREDVKEVTKILEDHGFEVQSVEDPDSKRMREEIRGFINRYGQDVENRLLFYFAGHGHTLELGYGGKMGYITPSDAANPKYDRSGFLEKAISMREVETFAEEIGAKHVLFLFDSCFSGTIFTTQRFSGTPANISEKTTKPVRQFIASGDENQTVPDKSIFRLQFVEGLAGEADRNKDGYVTGVELGEFLQEKVTNYSKKTQTPQYGKMNHPLLDKGDFVFRLKKNIAVPVAIPDPISNTEKLKAMMKWGEYQEEMQKFYDKGMEVDGKKIYGAQYKEQFWQGFLSSFAGDNPYSEKDNEMRQYAGERISYWKKMAIEPQFKLVSLRAVDGNKRAKSSFSAGETVQLEIRVEIEELGQARGLLMRASGDINGKVRLDRSA